MWTCPKCGTKVDPSFEVCWKCGTTADGVEDPSFVPADADGPTPSPRIDQRHAEKLARTVPIPEPWASPDPPGRALECYMGDDEMQAKFLADKLIEQGIPARLRRPRHARPAARPHFGPPRLGPRRRSGAGPRLARGVRPPEPRRTRPARATRPGGASRCPDLVLPARRPIAASSCGGSACPFVAACRPSTRRA